MKRKTLERIWFFIIAITIVCIIGVFTIFDENPLDNIKYVFLVVFIATPINLLMMYLTSKVKK